MIFSSPPIVRPLLELRNIGLNYGQFRALESVNFALGRSTIHAIVGEHGSGKSSLAMIMGGILKPHAGILRFNGREYRSLSITSAQRLGIQMVHQHVLSVNERFSVAENLFLTTAPFLECLTWKCERIKRAKVLLEQYEIDIDPLTPVEKLNLSDRIVIDILKHVHTTPPKLLILDEALEKLAASSFPKIVMILKNLREKRASILLVTHRFDDIYAIANKVSILKNGEVLLTDDVKNIDKLNLIKMAYMQLSEEQNVGDFHKEFYQLLKYNEAILRNLPANLIVTDAEHSIKLVNDYCKKSFGLEKSSYFNTPLNHLLASPNDEVRTLLSQARPYAEEQTFYQVPMTVNAISVICTLKVFPIHDGTFLIGHILILEDMTEYDRMQKQMILSEKLASVGLLAAGVAHEINNPLEIIYTYMSFMKYKFRAPDVHEALDTLKEQISHIANIVSNLLSFSDKNMMTNEEIEVNGEINKMLTLIKHNAGYKHIAIDFEPYPQDLFISASKHEIKQVILNLLKNSFEAMPSGGQVSIKTTLIAREEEPPRQVEIVVHDTGPGIADENPNNIFLPFYSTKKGTEQNLGLGMSVSYNIIKKYQGSMSVENIEGSGCRFIIRLPQTGSLAH